MWLHCCLHQYKTRKAGATATAVIVVLTPFTFYHFRRPKFNLQPLSFTFETFGKRLAITKTVARNNVKKIKENHSYMPFAVKCEIRHKDLLLPVFYSFFLKSRHPNVKFLYFPRKDWYEELVVTEFRHSGDYFLFFAVPNLLLISKLPIYPVT